MVRLRSKVLRGASPAAGFTRIPLVGRGGFSVRMINKARYRTHLCLALVITFLIGRNIMFVAYPHYGAVSRLPRASNKCSSITLHAIKYVPE
jgi:hypothetical protein